VLPQALAKATATVWASALERELASALERELVSESALRSEKATASLSVSL
jgi:uncharacterized lipoprotein YmbA